jgi:hypothetical protein
MVRPKWEENPSEHCKASTREQITQTIGDKRLNDILIQDGLKPKMG